MRCAKSSSIRHAPFLGFHDKILSGLQWLCTVQNIGDENSKQMFFSKQVQKEYMTAINKFVVDYAWLAFEADKQHKCLFTLPHKLHRMWHLMACQSHAH